MTQRILIIDDDELVTKSLQKLLEAHGYEAAVAQSGKEALEKVRNQEFHLIVCDIRMPEMDGIEIIKAIRKLRSAQDKGSIPEVLITGYADEEKHKSAVDLGVAEYLYKPFDNEKLLEVVRTNLGT